MYKRQIFLFTQKKKSNSFDGILGFGNDKTDKFTFNGSLNVNFRNMFNSFESINIFWQRNPDKGQTFDLKTDIPYLFGSNVGTNINVNIYRQDSTFANVKLIPAFYLHLVSYTHLDVYKRQAHYLLLITYKKKSHPNTRKLPAAASVVHFSQA